MPSLSVDATAPIWSDATGPFWKGLDLAVQPQASSQCVRTCLAIITGADPERFAGVNTQDPGSWSDALAPFEMALAYCPTDVRKVVHYIPGLLALDDLFLLGYYLGQGFLSEPTEDGWLAASHLIVIYGDEVLDPMGFRVALKDHDCGGQHCKRLFRVVPAGYHRTI